MKLVRVILCSILLMAAFACRPANDKGSAVVDFVAFQTNAIATTENAELRRRLDWHLTTLVTDYERVGERSSEWDKFANNALTLHAFFSVSSEDQFGAFAKRIGTDCKVAIHAGCNDPLIRYLYARFFNDVPNISTNGIGLESMPEARSIANAMLKSQYAPMRKYWACLWAALKAPTRAESPSADLQSMLHEAKELLKLLIKDKTMPDEDRYKACKVFLEVNDVKTDDFKQAWDEIETTFRESHGDTSEAALLRGIFWVEHAWKARGNGYADTVTKEGWRLFGERLAIAQRELEEAHRLNPLDPRPPTFMLRVLRGQGADGTIFEQWFQRAMNADTNNADACYEKLTYLEPKWAGSLETMLAFGRECLHSKNESEAVRRIVLEAHKRAEFYVEDPQNYLRGQEVWTDVKALFDWLINRHPVVLEYHHDYLRWAAQCNQPAEVDRERRIVEKLQAGLTARHKNAD